MTSWKKGSVSMEITGDPRGTPHVTALVEGASFKLQFPRGSGSAYSIHRLPYYRRYYRRMSQLHTHPSYKAIADALDRLTKSL